MPWAWAVNGVASVTATVLALLGIELSFTRVALLAILVYALGTLSLWSALPREAAPLGR